MRRTRASISKVGEKGAFPRVRLTFLTGSGERTPCTARNEAAFRNDIPRARVCPSE